MQASSTIANLVANPNASFYQQSIPMKKKLAPAIPIATMTTLGLKNWSESLAKKRFLYIKRKSTQVKRESSRDETQEAGKASS